MSVLFDPPRPHSRHAPTIAMAHFSFRNLFGKNANPPRTGVMANWPPKPAARHRDSLPVGRVVKFTENGPESSDTPLFQEKMEAHESASPFAIVQETAQDQMEYPPVADGPDGFTVGELASLAPANMVRRHAMPPDQVIELPHDLLRATLNAGQPAILLSQLHLACPALFFEPRHEDEDIVIALPEEKVARLLENAPPVAGSRAPSPFDTVPPVKLPEPRENAPMPFEAAASSSPWQNAPMDRQERPALVPLSKLPADAQLPTRARLPFARQGAEKTSETPLPSLQPPVEPVETAASQAPALPPPLPPLPTAAPPPIRNASGPLEMDSQDMALPATPPFSPAPAAPTPAFESINPFEPNDAAPAAVPSPPKTSWPRRFDSPFAIVSPGDVPAVIESPFAARPAVEPAQETASLEETAEPAAETIESAGPAPAPPALISLRLSELLRSLPPASLGFAPDRVPAAVRVEVPVEPLLAQLPSGRVTMPLAEVIEKIDSRYQPAFQKTKTGLSVVVPMREIFDNLPEITSEAPESVPVEDIFATPFSAKAKEDEHLNVFEPETPSSLFPTVPEPLQASASMEKAEAPKAEMPLPPPPPPPAAEPEALSPELAEPFVIVPEPAAAELPLPAPALPPVLAEAALPAPLPETAKAAPLSIPAEAVLSPMPPPPPLPASLEPPLAPPPAAPIAATNPFALAPRQNLGDSLADFDLTSPFDEDPVPLESLRDDPALETAPFSTAAAIPPPLPAAVPPLPAPASVLNEIAPPASTAPRPVVRSGVRFSFGSPTAPAATPPPLVQPPPVLPETATGDLIAAQEKPAAIAPPAASAEESPAAAALEDAPAAIPTFSYETPAPLPAAPAPVVAASSEILPAAQEIVASETGLLPPPPPFTEATPLPIAVPPEKEEENRFDASDEPLTAAAADERAAFVPDAASEPAPVEEPAQPAPIASAALPFAEEAEPFRHAVEDGDAPAPLAAAPVPETAPAFAEDPEPARDENSKETFTPAGMKGREFSSAKEHEPAAAAASGLVEEKPETETASESPSAIEDLSFGYVDDHVQLALRAIFSTDQTMRPEDVVHLSSQFAGLRACMILTPQGAVPGGAPAEASEEVRHFQERAGALFEKTASLVRELDPAAREQAFTLRTAKGVISFFAAGDVCLAALHAEPSFQPGVREKLTLVSRALADMLGS